jgi:hypothetical protein
MPAGPLLTIIGAGAFALFSALAVVILSIWLVL